MTRWFRTMLAVATLAAGLLHEPHSQRALAVSSVDGGTPVATISEPNEDPGAGSEDFVRGFANAALIALAYVIGALLALTVVTGMLLGLFLAAVHGVRAVLRSVGHAGDRHE